MLTTTPTLTDREPIIEQVTRVFVYADAHRWDDCQQLFTQDPFIDYSSSTGVPGSRVKAAQLMQNWAAFLPKFQVTQHLLSNFLVEIDGQQAQCFCYEQAIHYASGTQGGDLWTVYATCETELVKQEEGWKISLLRVTFRHQTGNTNLPAMVEQR